MRFSLRQQEASTLRRFLNTRWFQVPLGAVILAVGVYLNDLANRGRGGGNRPPTPPRANTSWTPFIWDEAGVEVEMPERPTRHNVSENAGDRRIPAIAYASSAGCTTFTVVYVEYPADIPLSSDQDELLAKSMEWLAARRGEPGDTIETIEYRGHSGVEALRTARMDDGRRVRARDRLFMFGRRAVIVGAVGDISDYDEEGARRFFDSLRFAGEN
ncbi:MAG TPA: hypothetical protein VJ783_26550 [Pirellulales bacterium]|nr:hypothetical protein [Pirellulales bacterium]